MRLGMQIIDGGLLAALRRFPDEVSKEIRLELLNELRTVVSDAKLHHRFDSKSNTLERSVRSEVSQSGLHGRVYLDPGIAPYAAPVHNGSKPHKIAAKEAGALYFVKGGMGFLVPKGGTKGGGTYKNKKGAFVIGKGYVNHPGTKKDPFLYLAFERNAKHIAEQMSKAIDKAKRIAGIK